jgi:pyruvate/2-oxoglutarate dehydrogenase complex dihydrolipoamide dehydrogenase (E3) component
MPHYDAIVIGSGQAGSPLSQKLADRGWAVALVEKEHLGGTCVNTGCTPTKTMIASAQVAHYARNADRWGVRAGAVNVDLPKVVARKDRVVGQWRAGLNRKVEERKTCTSTAGMPASSARTRSASARRCSKASASLLTRARGNMRTL